MVVKPGVPPQDSPHVGGYGAWEISRLESPEMPALRDGRRVEQLKLN
jgi:hypothetical protein